MEHWKQIVNYDNYEVSDLGNVRNKTTKKVLRKAIQNSGYTIVSLRGNGKTYTCAVHRLVMEAFKPIEQPSDYTVSHIDSDKTNNALDNLEWVKHSENIMRCSDPNELKVLEAMLCNTVKASLRKWYKMINDK